MTLMFAVIFLFLTAAFCLVNSLYVGSIWTTVCYASFTGILAVCFVLYEKRQRQRLLNDVQRALEDRDHFAVEESEIAPIARQLRLKRSQEALRKLRLSPNRPGNCSFVSTHW